ncbi:MAG TPA: septal ring lytic transglycosylase RlpA family protein [Ginsengibacter sp.]
MKKIIPVLLLVVIFSFNLCAQKKEENKQKASKESSKKAKSKIKYGTASYYAKKFNGRQTANGEIYNSEKYTAACNILPMGTWVKVTNLRNDKTIIVKINDRMNAKNKRLVDLSKIAANDLAFSGRGLTRVKVEVLENYHL